MSVYKRYFRVTEGPMVEEIDRLFELRIAAGKLYADLATKHGATGSSNYDRSGTFAGFTFASPPDKGVYRLDGKSRLWVPRKNVPAGKAIWAEIKSLPAPQAIEYALRLADLEPGMPMLTDGGRWYAPSLFGYGAPRNIWFVCVPWKDADPEKLKEYRVIKAAKKGFDRDLDAFLWEPPTGWTEIKRWQVEKEVDEINSAIAAKNGEPDEGDLE